MSNNINKKNDSTENQVDNIPQNTDSSTTYSNIINSTRAIPENINQIILSGIENANNIKFNLSQDESTTTTTNNTTTNNTTTNNTTTSTSTSNNSSYDDTCKTIGQTSTLLQNINNIKEQVVRLNLDPTQRLYFESCIAPLLTTLYELSATSATLAASANILTTSPVVHPKNSHLKDTLHLIYDINEQCEDVYKKLRKRIDDLINMC